MIIKTQLGIFLALVGISFPTDILARVSHSVGVARDSVTDTIRYIEQHQYLLTGGHLVTYFDTEGNVLVERKITYPSLPQHPQIIENDFTRNVKMIGYINANILYTRKKSPNTEEFYEVPLDDSTIIDAGFDTFLRTHWDNFKVGKPQTYKLAITSRQRLLSVNIVKLPGDKGLTPFVVTPKNFLVRLLLPEIHLWYDQSRRLFRYQGLTNLNLAKGQSRNVSIEFTHYDRPL